MRAHLKLKFNSNVKDVMTPHLRTKTLSFVAIFAALYMVLRMIPTVPMFGTGASFSLSDILPAIYGIILGPFVGGASIIIGTFIAMGLGRPVIFLGLDFLPATVCAIVAGLLYKRNWLTTIGLYSILLIAFSLYPLTSFFISIQIGNAKYSFPFPWLHIIALVVLLSPLGQRASSLIKSLKTVNITVGLTTLAFIGTMAQHLMGNLLFETILAKPVGSIDPAAYPIIWTGIFFVYPIERIVLVLVAVLIGTPLIKILKQSFI